MTAAATGAVPVKAGGGKRRGARPRRAHDREGAGSMSKSFYVSLLASVSVGAMSASVAHAAPATASVTDAATAAAAGPAAAASGTVGEVIVTAQHRRGLQQTGPIAITAS